MPPNDDSPQLTLTTIRPRFTPTAVARWSIIESRIADAWASGADDSLLDCMRSELDADSTRVLRNIARSFAEADAEAGMGRVVTVAA